MNRRVILIVVPSVVVAIILIGFLAWGCSSATSSSSSSAAQTLTISGTLSSGTISSRVARSLDGPTVLAVANQDAALASYTVIALNTETGEFTEGTTGTDGAFSVDVEVDSDDSVQIVLLDDNYQFAGPVAFGTSGDNAVTGINLSEDLNLGSTVYSTADGMVAPATAPTANLDTDIVANTQSGQDLVVTGAGNLGKGSGAAIQSGQTYDSTVIDGDYDGIPDLFDANNDGDALIDDLEAVAPTETPDGSKLQRAYVFMNLKVPRSQTETFQTSYSQFDIAMHIDPASGYTISSARLVNGPAWKDTAVVTNTLVDNPDNDELWQNTSPAYKLIEGENGFMVFVDGLVPVTDVNASDVLKFEVTFSDGTTENVICTINKVFTDIPKLLQWKCGASGDWQTISDYTTETVGSFTNNTIYMRISRPLDENGDAITGGRYTLEYSPALETSGSVFEVEVVEQDDGTGDYIEFHQDMSSLWDTTVTTGTDLLIAPCLRGVYNDNAAQNNYFSYAVE